MLYYLCQFRKGGIYMESGVYSIHIINHNKNFGLYDYINITNIIDNGDTIRFITDLGDMWISKEGFQIDGDFISFKNEWWDVVLCKL